MKKKTRICISITVETKLLIEKLAKKDLRPVSQMAEVLIIAGAKRLS